MKNLNLLFFVLSFLITANSKPLRIRILDPTVALGGQTYKLFCDNAIGLVTYQVDGLPANAELKGNEIFVSNQVNSGNYVVRIRAEDSTKQRIEQILTLVIDQFNLEDIELETVKKEVEVAEVVEEKVNRLGSILQSYSSIETLSSRAKKIY